MITERFVTLYGFLSVAVMAASLGLIWFKVVPESLYIPLFIFALAAFIGRITLRIIASRGRKQQDPGNDPPQTPSAP